MINEFVTSSRIIIGEGSIEKVGEIVRDFGKKALIVCGKSLRFVDRLEAQLKRERIEFSIFTTEGEPTVSTVKEALSIAEKGKVDFIIGIGGGSSLDTGKAVSILASNGGDIYDYLEVIGKGKPFIKPALPYIAIPTTAGTGTEVTKNAVIGSPADRVKVSLRSSLMVPRIALIDPELTYDLPLEVTASSGMDALTQLIEPYVSNQPNPITDALCKDGIMRIANNLPKLLQNHSIPISRKNMIIASLFSGMALANAKLGAVHGFAGVLGGMYSASHGEICATLLPHVVKMNITAMESRQPDNPSLIRYREIAELILGNNDPSLTNLIRWIEDLCKELNIPTLNSLGVNVHEFDIIIDKAMRASSMKGNPIELTREELKKVLEIAY